MIFKIIISAHGKLLVHLTLQRTSICRNKDPSYNFIPSQIPKFLS